MEKVQKILDQYDIPEILPIKMIRESGDNKVYQIGEKNKKILRLSKRLPIEDVKFEYEALQHLYLNSFPVPAWIKTQEGNFYATSEDVEVAVIFDFLEGYHVVIDRENLPTKDQAYTAGRALGQISEIGKSFTPSSARRRNIFIELERVVQNENVFKKEFEGGEDFVVQVKEAIKFGRESKSPVSLIHNDYRAGNVFFKTDQEISGVIDYDWSCIGPSIKDLALGVLEWSFPDGRTKPDLEIFDSFLDGYNSVSAIKFSKGKELFSWIKFAALSDVSTFFCDRLSNPELKKKIAYSYMYLKYLYFSKT